MAVSSEMYMDVCEKLSRVQQQLAEREARCAELENALVWSLGKLSMEFPVAGGNVSYIRAFDKAEAALNRSSSKAFVKRAQAEAVEHAVAVTPAMGLTSLGWPCIDKRHLDAYAQRLRNEADEAEKAGGDHG